MSKHEMRFSYREDPTKLRTESSYKKDLLANDVSKTGIKEANVFHKIRGFHIPINIVVDIMHDLFEGVCDTFILFLKKNIFLSST